jgi:hypothetical protein
MPVTFPPGRAKLSIRPCCKGAPAGAMTIGIVRVAAMAALTAGGEIDARPDKLGSELRGAVASRLRIEKLDRDVPAMASAV